MSKDPVAIYGQLENTCGLASLLMALQPEQRGIAEQFNDWWNGVEQIIDDAANPAPEIAWERVLDYILLKIPKNERLRTFIEDRNPDLAMLFFLDIENRVQKILTYICRHEGPRGMFLKNAYDVEGRVCDPLLGVHLGIMKTNADLAVLYHFLGGKFIHRYESSMPTGAIYFTREEVKDQSNKDFQKKVQILEQAFRGDQQVFLGQAHHWMIVHSMKGVEENGELQDNAGQKQKRYFLYVLDPEQELEKTLPFTVLTENFLFYFFDWDEISLSVGMQLLTEVLGEEIQKDAKLFQRYRTGDIGDEKALGQQLIEFVGEMPEEEGEMEEEIGRAAELALIEVESPPNAPLPPPRGILTGDQWMERIRAAIKRNFSDYSNL